MQRVFCISKFPPVSHRQQRLFSSLRRPPNNLPHVQIVRASLAGRLLDQQPQPSPADPALIVLTHASEVSEAALRACLNARRDIPTMAVDMTRSLNAVAMDPVTMVLGRTGTREFQLTGLPHSGKSTFALQVSRYRKLVVKKPRIGKKFDYRMIQPGHSVAWCEYMYQPESQLADMRPITLWDPPSEPQTQDNVLQAFGCLPRRDLDGLEALQILLNAIHTHADVSERHPAYWRKMDVGKRFSSAEEFRNAVGDTMSLEELILACQQGEYGNLLHGDIVANSDDHLIKLHRGKPIVGYNQPALQMFEDSLAAQDAQSGNKPKGSEDDRHEPVDRPELPQDDTPILQFPQHRRCFNCMICAGFIRRDDKQNVFGCGHTKILTRPYDHIIAYYSRMTEAFGNTKHIRYLMKDSLACTLMRKHKLISRAAAYKKFKAFPEFPMPNRLRPPFLRSDKPIPFVPRCLRVTDKDRSSCFDTHAARLLDTVPNYLARANKLRLDKEFREL